MGAAVGLFGSGRLAIMAAMSSSDKLNSSNSGSSKSIVLSGLVGVAFGTGLALVGVVWVAGTLMTGGSVSMSTWRPLLASF